MHAAARNLTILGATIDLGAGGWFATLATGREALTSNTVFLAAGLAGGAVIGSALILAAFMIHVVDDLIDRSTVGSHECVMARVSQAVDEGFERLVESATGRSGKAGPTQPAPERR